MHFGGAVGISASVVPYAGGSRRELLHYTGGYNVTYEDVIIQEKKSLIAQYAPLGDSGSGTKTVIPVGNHALIITWSYIGKDSDDYKNLLASIKVGNSLDLNKCDETTDEVKFTGTIKEIYYSCEGEFGGTCEINVDDKQVVVKSKGPNEEKVGTLIGINLNESDKNKFIGKKVEIFGRKVDKLRYVIDEDKKYYIKLLD